MLHWDISTEICKKKTALVHDINTDSSQTFEQTRIDVIIDSADESRDLVFVIRRRKVGKADGLWSVRNARHQPQTADQAINQSINLLT